jgi:ankyrin repeat protein
LAFFRLRGLSLKSVDKKGGTPLHWAAFLGCENAVNFLVAWQENADQ